MADEQQTYTYPETSGNEDYSKNAIKGGTETIKSILTNKRVMTLIAVMALMVFFVFRKTNKVKPHMPPSAPPVQKVVVPEVSTMIPPPPVMPAVQVQSPSTSEMVNVISSITALENKLSTEMVLQQNMEARQDQLMQKVNEIAAILEENAQAEQKAKAAVKPTKHHKPEPVRHFTLQALVDGRAWITDAHSTYTVVKGDKLASYGVVTEIHADEGYVETSSGRNITFEHSDQ